MLLRRFTARMLCVLALTRVAQAQSIRGVVFYPDGVTRAPGMLVLVTPNRGTASIKTLTSDRGEFSAAVPAPGVYSIRVLRIGFQPTILADVMVEPSSTLSLTVVLNGASVTLAPVTVRGDEQCRIDRASGEAIAKLWQEARTALTVAQITVDQRSIRSTWLRYERIMDSSSRIIKRQSVTRTSAPTARPFRSTPPDSLARFGYISAEAGDLLFRAPDANALLSDQFAAAHCFHAEPPGDEHPHWIGIAFRPSRERESISDIEGVFWLDEASIELRLLEYRYTNTPPQIEGMNAGGRVEFLRLSTGDWLINRWSIRVPLISARRGAAVNGLSGGRVAVAPPTRAIQSGVSYTGGEVSEVTEGGAAILRGGGATYRLQLRSSDSEMAVAGAKVDFVGTPYSARADSAGVAVVDHVLAGTYAVEIATAGAQIARLPAVERIVTMDSGAVMRDSVTLPRANDLVRRACKAPVSESPESLVFGVVTDSLGEPIANAIVSVAWQPVLKSAAGSVTVFDPVTHEVTTDEGGRWRVCGVLRERAVFVRAQKGAQRSERFEIRIPADRSLYSKDLRMTRPTAGVLR